MDGTELRPTRIEGHEDKAAVGWSSMRGWVQRYLERQGVPAGQAEGLSHEIVVASAREIEALSPHQMRDRVRAEADTRLLGWQAARRAGLAEAA